MGIGKVNVAANSYLKNAEFVFDQNEQEQRVVDVPQKPVPQAKTGEQILKESETLPKGYALEKSNETPVDKYKQNGDKIMQEIEASMKKAGVKPKSLEYSGTPEDFKTPKTVEEAKYRYRQMIYNGQIDKMTDKEIDKEAKIYIDNKEKGDKFNKTHSFMDKDKYKQAEAEKDVYYKELRQQGLSRKEAKAKAYEKFGENKYMSKGGWFGIGKSSARKFIERNQDLFYENGEYSEQKHKEYVLANANIAKQKGEATNYRYSLKERYTATAYAKADGRKTTIHQQGEVGKAVGMSTENNNTTLYRGLAIGGATIAGAGAGYAIGGFVITSTSGSASGAAAAAGAGAAGAGAGATAGAGAVAGAIAGVTVPAWVTATAGGLIGGTAGSLGSNFLRDKGEKIVHIQDIKPQIPPVEVPPVQVSFVKLPPKQEKICPETPETENVCKKTVQKGSSWAYYAENSGITINGKKPAGKELNAYLYAQQLMYGIKNPKGLKENRFLPVGAEYVQHSDFSKLFENKEIMNKYGNILNVLKDADINVDNCVDLKGPVRGRRNPNFRYGGDVTGNTTIRTRIYDCDQNLIRVEDK